MISDIDCVVWSSFLGLLWPGPAHAVAGQFDPVGIVNEAVEDGVGIGRIANDFMPAVDGKLRGDHGGAAPIAIFEDFQEIMAGVEPETVIGWHRRGFRAFWRWKSRSGAGRPKVRLEIGI